MRPSRATLGSVPKRVTHCFPLEEFSARSRYPTLVAGDFNARHKDWCKKSNRSGRNLKTWSLQFHFSILAPSNPTFFSKQGKSTIDSLLSRGITLTKPNTVSDVGPWGGASDHTPVTTTVVTKPDPVVKTSVAIRVSSKLLRSITHTQKAGTLYNDSIPALTREMDTAVSIDELERLYAEFEKVVLLPWRSANGKRTAKFQTHWDDRLEKLGKERDKIFRKIKKAGDDSTELWSKFLHIDRHIKRSVRNKKKEIRRRELSEMIKRSVPETQKWVKKVMRRYNTVALQSLQRGSPLDLASFTKHMETNKADISRVSKRKFVVPPTFRTYIQRALSSLPNGCAAGQGSLKRRSATFSWLYGPQAVD